MVLEYFSHGRVLTIERKNRHHKKKERKKSFMIELYHNRGWV